MKIKKINKRYIIIGILIIILIIGLYSQAFFPLHFSDDEIRIQYLAEGDWSYFEYGYENSNSDQQNCYQNFNTSKALPSDVPSDYLRIDYSIKCNNHSIMNIYNGMLTVKKLPSKYEDRILYSMLQVTSTGASRFKGDNAQVIVFAYIGNMSEDEIYEMVNDFKFSLNYERDVFGISSTSFKIKDDDVETYTMDEDFYL